MYYIYIDEAGRGPIAWPVTVGAVVEKIDQKLWLERFQRVAVLWQKKKRGQERIQIDDSLYKLFPANDKSLYDACCDSKLLTEIQRESLYEQLQKLHTDVMSSSVSKSFYTASISADDIDTYGMTWALRTAIVQIVEQVTTDRSQVVLVVDWPFDFWLRKEKAATVIPVIDGDDHIPMISAASILAKVTRDRYMIELAKTYPQYWFENHKWYGTKWHYEAIKEYWTVEWTYRKTYIK